MTPVEQVRAKCREVIARANTLYNVDLEKVNIRFDLRGRVAGWAQMKRGVFTVKFNHDMITRGDEKALRDMIDDTVPHEFAHIVCFMRRELGRNHDAGWARVCRELGGTGGRTHSTDVIYGKGTTYEYITDRGHKVRVGDRHHATIQRGGILRWNKGRGAVTMACGYSIVGQNGRTLANPIVKQAPNSAANIEASLRLPDPETLRVADVTRSPAPAPVPTPIRNRFPVGAVTQLAGESKAATSRRIMLSGYRGAQSYEVIIAAMMAACGYDRQLARATFKANAHKVGIPSTFG